MLTLTAQQLQQAGELAYQVSQLQVAKANVQSQTVSLSLSPLGCPQIDYHIPVADVQAELDRRIAAATQALVALGITLAAPPPPTPAPTTAPAPTVAPLTP
jgi:hypothetical protein